MFRMKRKGARFMYSVFDIANWFLKNAENITNKKLQKLVYYAYSWYLVFNNETADKIELKLCDADFEAWVHGAVCPILYDKYKVYGSGNIERYEGELKDFSGDETDLLEQVNKVYGKFNGNELESICHQENPWIKARRGLSAYEPSNNRISDKDIFEYYSSKLS